MKAKMGRPPKENGRKEVSVGLSPAVLKELDAYVKELRVKAPGSSRGDVLSSALAAFRPFRLWKLRRRS
jgi:hypothetical protein